MFLVIANRTNLIFFFAFKEIKISKENIKMAFRLSFYSYVLP